jgi:hypothetical protein
MLRITVQRDDNLVTLKVEGKLSGAWVDELERAWLSANDQTRPMHVDLSGVTFVGEGGKKVLGWIFEQGATLHATDCMNRSIIEEVQYRHHRHASNGALHSVLTKVIVTITVVCSVARGVRGQESAPPRFTLPEVVQTALKQNRQVLLVNLSVATRHQRSIEVRSLYYYKREWKPFTVTASRVPTWRKPSARWNRSTPGFGFVASCRPDRTT